MKKIFFLLCFLFYFNVHASNKFDVKLDKCVDGDTAKFLINGESKTVRFLSINAPEIQHDDVMEEFYGNESSEYTCKLLKRSSSIKLQYDPKSDKFDKYGRVLAWVFIDDELLQKKLVSKGYAEVKYVYDDYLYSEELKSLEGIAKKKNLGMWSDYTVSNDNDFYFLLNKYYVFVIIFIVIYIIKRICFKKV